MDAEIEKRLNDVERAFRGLIEKYTIAMDALDAIASWGDDAGPPKGRYGGMDEPGAAQTAREALAKIRETPDGRP